MSNLLFSKTAVHASALRVKDAIMKSRKKEALEDWNYIHRPGFWSLMWRAPKPIPQINSEWEAKHIESSYLNGGQLRCAEQFIKYCNRQDAPDVIAVSREDAERLWLV